MNEITKVALENEMDLILAHKQTMRLAELAGLSLSAQTTFATAVSEVSRSAIGRENDAHLTLYIADMAVIFHYSYDLTGMPSVFPCFSFPQFSLHGDH